ncbi:class I SAM-dependent methyltransferase [Tautonia plasticadhaerens]|uniref:Ribosomal protein L11 methyltransferase n=1 Tax=Tautonia plasticadhaerens TaxID=2527974 RepID=A0A518HEI7_9BACT|nr:protein N-lysine methyltransferase family protein [Tautonia plasticadhaerens]QDV39251.1 ribosomal protein L11 methyltransferase [Tautonia plasticadhaerens]
MSDNADKAPDTSDGKFPLFDYRLRQGGREWSVLHTGAVLTDEDETRAIVRKTNRLPYGLALWPSAIAPAHEIADRAAEFRGRGVLELGAGTGLPGIVAASLGARVVQTDRDELVIQLCRHNGERNGVRSVEYRLADWTAWGDDRRRAWIIGSDILYGEALHPHLHRIFASNLANGGGVALGPAPGHECPPVGGTGSGRLGDHHEQVGRVGGGPASRRRL